jgi:hypothetical protein
MDFSKDLPDAAPTIDAAEAFVDKPQLKTINLTPELPATLQEYRVWAVEVFKKFVRENNIPAGSIHPQAENWFYQIYSKRVYSWYGLDCTAIKERIFDHRGNIHARWDPVQDYSEKGHFTLNKYSSYSRPNISIGEKLDMLPWGVPIHFIGSLPTDGELFSEMLHVLNGNEAFLKEIIKYLRVGQPGFKINSLSRVSSADMGNRVAVWQHTQERKRVKTSRLEAISDWVFSFGRASFWHNNEYSVYELRTLEEFLADGCTQHHCLGRNHKSYHDDYGYRYFSIRKKGDVKGAVTFTLRPYDFDSFLSGSWYFVSAAHTFANKENYDSSESVRMLVDAALAANPNIRVKSLHL